MLDKPFYINQRFFIEPASNLLRDEVHKKQTRLEPRIMELLCVLAEKPSVTLTRDELVNIIWKDYGGGDEGLTQGISAIRKLLSDPGKELIQTIPKKGYCFKGEVSFTKENLDKPGMVQPVERKKRGVFIIAASLLTILLVVIFFIFNRNNDEGGKRGRSDKEVTFPGNNPKIDSSLENETNTIVTRSPDNIVYKLVMIGDEPPRFYINDSLLPVEKWEPFQPLINNLKRQMVDRNKSE